MIQASPTIIGLIACAGLELFFFLMHAMYWIKRPSARIHAILALWFMAAAVFSTSRLMQFFSSDIPAGVLFGKTSALCHYTLLWLGMNFVYEYTQKRPKYIEKLFWLIILSASVMLIITSEIYISNQGILRQTIFGEKFFGAIGGKYFLWFGFILPISFFVFFLKLLFAKNIQERNLFVIIGFGCCAFFSLIDITIIQFGFNIIRFYDYAYLPLGIGYTFAMISHHSDMYNQMEVLVDKRTEELRNTNLKLKEEIMIRSKAEEEALLNKDRFESIYNGVNEAVFIHNESGAIIDVNGKMLEMFKCSKEQALQLSVGDYSEDIAPYTQAEAFAFIQQALKGEEVIFEWRAKDLQNNLFWAENYMRSALIGHDRYVIVTIRDITKRKEIDFELQNYRVNLEEKVYQRTRELDNAVQEHIFLNDELHKLNRELESQRNELLTALENLKLAHARIIESEKMAALGVLIAGIAHEINNPLNYISGSVINFDEIIETMRTSILDDFSEKLNLLALDLKKETIDKTIEQTDLEKYFKDLRKLISYINNGTNKIIQIVKGLRLFSRSDKETKLEVDIHEHIDAVLVMLDYQIKDKIRVVKEYGALPNINCYPGKLSQVFMNLFTNSIHAIENEGTIYIKTNLSDDKQKMLITIKDSGSGISDENKDKVFVPFFTTKEVGKGIGLGLSIVFSIIDQHNGIISFESKLNEGTEFTITLPYL